VIQAAVVGLVLFSAAVVAVRRAASRYFVVDAAGFAASYDDHHHDPMGNPQEQGAAAADLMGPCAACGGVASKKCSRCKRVRYWCVRLCLLPSIPPCELYWYNAPHVILPSSQRNLSLLLCDLCGWGGQSCCRDLARFLTFALLLLLMKSNVYNRGLVSWRIGVSGGSLRCPLFTHFLVLSNAWFLWVFCNLLF